MDRIAPLLCCCVHVSVAKEFFHGVNMPQYVILIEIAWLQSNDSLYGNMLSAA
jgi:hypothetical protein